MEFLTPPVMLAAAIGLAILWRSGVLATFWGRVRPAQNVPRTVASQPSMAPPDDQSLVMALQQYPARILGLAFQMAVRREADTETARLLAESSRATATAAYQAPFSVGPAPPPPPLSGAPPVPPYRPPA